MARVLSLLAVVGAVAGTGVVPAAASHIESTPSHINQSFEDLDTYRPRLDIQDLDVRPTLYGVKTTSSEYSHDVYQYWAWYPAQEGFLGLDSHYEDREPIQVYVDPESGDVDHVNWAAYHWLKDSSSSPVLYNDTHPDLGVVKPHHQYVEREGGVLLEVNNLTNDTFRGWLDNGLESALVEGGVKDPAIIDSRESWWSESSCYGAVSCADIWRATSRLPWTGGAS